MPWSSASKRRTRRTADSDQELWSASGSSATRTPDLGTNAPQAVWRDADGKLVGPYSGGEVLHQRNGRVFRLRIDRATGRLRRDDYPPVMAFYESSDCSGVPLFRPAGVLTLTEAFPLTQSGTSAYYADEDGSARATHSFWDDVFFTCTAHSLTLDVAPPKTLDLSGFREPFTLAIE
jgi:hypothetical protein